MINRSAAAHSVTYEYGYSFGALLRMQRHLLAHRCSGNDAAPSPAMAPDLLPSA